MRLPLEKREEREELREERGEGRGEGREVTVEDKLIEKQYCNRWVL
jgi:hypothetical protein